MFAAPRWQERGGKDNNDHSDGKKINKIITVKVKRYQLW